jgi:serine/threonine protein kinase
MRGDSPRWHEVTPSAFPAERAALRRVRDLLPAADPYQAWSNFTFVATATGHVREIDLLVLAATGLFLVEIKSLHGRLASENGTWQQHRRGRTPRLFDNPLILTDQKSKELRGRLTRAAEQLRAAGRLQGRCRIPFVQPVVFLSEPDLVCELEPSDLPWVYGPEGPRSIANPLPSIADLLLDRRDDRPEQRQGQRPEQQGQWQWQRPTAEFAAALPGLLDRIGIRPSRRRLTVGKWKLEPEPYEVGPTWQDHHARHETTRTYRRVRIYLHEREADAEVRQSIDAAALREFRATEGVEHPGILGVDQLEEHEDGPALVIRQPRDALRLDHYLIEHRANLDLRARLDLLRQLADAVRYAHRRGLVHRALSPRAVVVTPDDGDSPGPRLRVGEWQAAERRPAGRGEQVRPTTNAGRHVERSAEAYLAPEFRGEADGTVAADVFGIGAIAYLLVTGRPPAESRQALIERLARDGALLLPPVRDAVPTTMTRLVAAATRAVVADRLDNLDRLLAGLDRIDDELRAGGPGTTGTTGGPAPGEPRRAAAGAAGPSTGGRRARGSDPWTAKPGDRLSDGSTVRRVLGTGSTARALLVARGKTRLVLKVARSEAGAERLEREAAALRRLNDPRIVRLLREPYQLDGRTVVELALAGEETLRERLRARGRCAPDELERFGDQLLGLVDQLEREGVYHRDIKPDNLVVAGDGPAARLVLLDFSLAGTPAGDLAAGTHGYLDPFLGTPDRPGYDAAAERYAVAATLHELATGLLPRWGDDGTAPRFVHAPTLAAERFPPELRDRLTTFFERALAKDASRRFGSPHQLRRSWEQALRPAPGAGEAGLPRVDAGPARPAVPEKTPDATALPAEGPVSPVPPETPQQRPRLLRPARPPSDREPTPTPGPSPNPSPSPSPQRPPTPPAHGPAVNRRWIIAIVAALAVAMLVSATSTVVGAVQTFYGIVHPVWAGNGSPKDEPAGDEPGPGTTRTAAPLPAGTRLLADDFSGTAGKWAAYDKETGSVGVNRSSGTLRFAVPPGGVVSTGPERLAGPAQANVRRSRLDATVTADPFPSGATFGLFCRVLPNKDAYAFYLDANGVSAIDSHDGEDEVLATISGKTYLDRMGGRGDLDHAHLHVECSTADDDSGVWLRLWDGDRLVMEAEDRERPYLVGYPAGLRADLASGHGTGPFEVTVDDVAVYRL